MRSKKIAKSLSKGKFRYHIFTWPYYTGFRIKTAQLGGRCTKHFISKIRHKNIAELEQSQVQDFDNKYL